jgi:hypothetical protein
MAKPIPVFLFCLLYSFGTAIQAQDVENILNKDRRKGFFEDFTKADPFKVSGNFGLNLRSYNATGIENRQAPFIWFLSGQANVKIYKLNIPISALATAQSLTYAHPFHRQAYENRFTRIGASPYYKWIKLHFGHRNMNFSPLTVANHTYLGAGFELNPGKIRLAGFYGRMARTEPQDLSLLQPNLLVFDRTGWGMKVGYGNANHFLDLIVFKAKDAPGKTIPTNLDSVKIFQAENMVTALNGQTMLFKKIKLSMELASSAFSKNDQDPSLTEKNFVHPSFLMQKRTSTTYRYALNAGLQYQISAFSLGANYRRVEPDYRSLGAYFFNDDLDNLTGNAGFGLFKNKVRINGSAGIQRNNLRGSKATQFTRTIGSLDINYLIKAFTFGFNYSNYTSKIDYVLNLNQDSLNAVIVTRQAALNGGYTKVTANKNRHVINANVSLDDVTDDVQEVDISAASKMLNSALNYVFSTKEDTWKISGRVNYNQNELSQVLVHRYGLGGGVQREVVPKKWSLGFDINYFNSRGENIDNQTINMRVNSPITISKHHRLDIGLLLLNRAKTNTNSAARNFNEVTGTVNYVFSF